VAGAGDCYMEDQVLVSGRGQGLYTEDQVLVSGRGQGLLHGGPSAGEWQGPGTATRRTKCW